MANKVRPEISTYRLDRMLGEGLSSRVFAAIREDSRGFSRQRVVLKILKNETDVSWLKREFTVLSRLRSRHCVSVLGWENLPEGPALVLEQVDGLTLVDLLRSEKLTPVEIEEIIRQAQVGLRDLHETGLHHGDLSPANIMVDRNGLVRLIDFALGGTSEAGVVTGTLPYICPERWSGQFGSAASDLFSLGLIRIDLFAGLATAPHSPGECRLRAEALAGSGCPLLELDPSRRHHRAIPPQAGVREHLATRVRTLLAERDAVSQRTAVLVHSEVRSRCVRAEKRLWGRVCTKLAGWPLPQVTRSALAYRFACGLACVFIPVSPGASQPQTAKPPAPAPARVAVPPAFIQVRSLKWLRIEIDGVERGFAPLSVALSQPGRHRLRWWSATGQGEVFFTVRAGETVSFSEKSLRSAARAGPVIK